MIQKSDVPNNQKVEAAVPSGVFDLKKMESEIAKHWEENNTRKKALSSRKGSKPYYFMDGPPYATGYIHMGTGLNKTLKDYYMRFWRMSGFDVNSQPGYDTHGVPIENKVEKKLGLKHKSDIEEFGIEKFNKECRNFATEFIGIMNQQFNDLGVWMDWENPYLTLHDSYIEGAWHTFKIAYEKGLLYKGIYPVHICSHCATAVAYSEIEYQKATDPAIFVKFAAKNIPNTYFVIWTTTPWTLPSNTGIMVHPKFDYAKVKVDNDTLIIAKNLVKTVMNKAGIKQYTITSTVKGKELAGEEYLHPLKDILPLQKNVQGKVILSEMFVTLTDGAGLVHTAPGHGKEDFKAGTENNLPKLCPVNLDGTFDKSAGKFAGKYVKDADAEIIAELKSRGAILASEKVTHDYPHCWRCKTPLLQVAVPQWFFKVTEIRDKLVAENKKVGWVPEWAQKRFGDWILNLSDWPISRQRYWGIPLPIWVCDKCDAVKVIGSKDELGECAKNISDLHRPYIDTAAFRCKCGGTMKRIPDVLDVWFDSGVSSWASLGYPKNKDLFNKMWPAELNIEGPDQIRGWWNSQLICSVITFGKKPFNNIIMHGMVLDSKGNKMSKSLGNVIAPSDVVEKFSRDVLRTYLLTNTPETDFFFDWESVKSVQKFFNILFNSVNFMKSYAPKNFEPSEKFDAKKGSKMDIIDRWMISRINSLIVECDAENKKYTGYKAVSAIQDFVVNDFSRTYIKLTRERTSPNYEGKGKEDAFSVMDYVLKKTVVLLAPAAPFSSERIYRDLGGKKESVHLLDFPSADKKLIDAQLERDMKISLDVVEAINSARQENNLRLRWPLKKATVSGDKAVVSAIKRLADVVCELANVKEIAFGDVSLDIEVKPNYKVFGPAFGKDAKAVADLLAKADAKKLKEDAKKGKIKLDRFELTPEMLFIREKVTAGLAGKTFAGGAVYLDTARDEEIIQESLVRELVRHIQTMRKEAGLDVKEKITLYLSGDEKLLSKWKSEIEKSTTSSVIIGAGGKRKSTFEFEEEKVEVGF